jgi:deoxyribonuclease-4
MANRTRNHATRRAPRYLGPAGPLGFHVGIAGGLARAPANARRLGARAMQIFTRSPRMWRAAPLDPAVVRAFRDEIERQEIAAVVAHAIYLLNLASPREDLWRRSIEVFIDDVRRCHALGIDRLVIHPGSRGEASPAAGRRRLRQALREITRRTNDTNVKILLESTAGAGAHLGGTLDELAWLIDHHPTPERLGVCLDSCHLFAAGYPLHEPRGLPLLLDDLERTVGLARLGCWHLNDSVGEWASHRDRHARVGRGKIGRAFFRQALHEPRFFGVPKILEIPGGEATFAADLRLLARLAPPAVDPGH